MKLLSKTVLGVVGLSAIALVSGVKPATAASVELGTDYLFTPGGGSTFLDFDGPGGQPPVSFRGVPINFPLLGLTDTIVQRKDNVTLDATTLDANGLCISAACQTRIEMTDLSLQSLDGSISVALDPNRASTGWMTINHENPDTNLTEQGTFSSVLDVFFQATFANGDIRFLEKRFVVGDNPYTLNPLNPLYKDDLNDLPNPDNSTPGIWSHRPPADAIIVEPGDPTISQGQNIIANNQTANWHNRGQDFFVRSAIHETGNGTHNVVAACTGNQACPVPEPMTIFGSGLALGFGTLLHKKYSRKLKKQAVS